MPGSLLLGIDIGTYSSKGVLCTPEGDVVASHVVEHGISMPRPGWVEQDADAVWWSDTVQICRALVTDDHPGEAIAGVIVGDERESRRLRPHTDNRWGRPHR